MARSRIAALSRHCQASVTKKDRSLGILSGCVTDALQPAPQATGWITALQKIGATSDVKECARHAGRGHAHKGIATTQLGRLVTVVFVE